ncbi:hypothetical protein AMS68_007260 [Peltaster fructicola]|uniref:AB hydrolase-1 domain-containing protein n=1 Tax=Peltaster fructicola TaxID=286661 RepID=A0A6H0Y412_9PEZI|nr:hypothetical protein AMS68_007260 [Peltaster fructicola]
MPATRPSIVVVPGAHHIPEHFHAVTTLLESDGYRVVGITLPSPENSLPPNYQGDLTTIREAILGELHRGLDVLLVVHSASGVTGPAAMQGLAKRPGSSEPGVVRILGISAILARPGQIGFAAVADGQCCQWRIQKDNRYVMYPYDQPGGIPEGPGAVICSPVHALYNDMTAEQSRWAYDLCVPVYGDMGSVVVDYAGWQDVPMTYVICEEDKAIFPQVQQEIIRNAGIKPTVRRLAASHSPFISVSHEVAALIEEAAEQA